MLRKSNRASVVAILHSQGWTHLISSAKLLLLSDRACSKQQVPSPPQATQRAVDSIRNFAENLRQRRRDAHAGQCLKVYATAGSVFLRQSPPSTTQQQRHQYQHKEIADARKNVGPSDGNRCELKSTLKNVNFVLKKRSVDLAK